MCKAPPDAKDRPKLGQSACTPRYGVARASEIPYKTPLFWTIGAMRRVNRNSWFSMGRLLQLLATLILMVAPALDAAAASAERGDPPVSTVQLLPAWLNIVEDPLDHPVGHPHGGHCNQAQLANFLPAADQIFPLSIPHLSAWDTDHRMPVLQTCPMSRDRPPRS